MAEVSPKDSLNVSHDQRLHDLRTVHTDFKAILSLVRAGYRFDDADAAPVLEQLAKAVGLLDIEIKRLVTEWKSELDADS